MGELSHLWYVGVVIVFIGSLGGAMGDTMVRRSYVEAGDSAKPRTMLRTPLFVIGIFLTVVMDPFFTFLGLLFAPSSIVTPFAGVHIFWAVLIAHFWLKEPMSFWQVVGSVGIVVGVILIVCFSSKGANIGGIDDFDAYARSAKAIVYIVVSGAILIIILLAVFSLYPCSFGHWDYSIKRLATALASGFLGGNTNVALKFFTIIVVQVFSGNTSVFGNWRTYVVTICIVILAVSQLVFLNIALRRYEAVYVVPTINSCLVAAGTIGSILVLHEIPTNWPAFCLGLVICVSGILVLTIAQEPAEQHAVAPLHTDKSALHVLEAAGEEQPKSEEIIELSQRRPSLEVVSRSLSLPATAVADMAIILNSKALYSMYTMKEKQQRQIAASGGFHTMSSSPALPSTRRRPSVSSGGGRAESRRMSVEAITGWFSRLRDRIASGAGGRPHAAEEGGDPTARSTVSEPALPVNRFRSASRVTATAAPVQLTPAAAAAGAGSLSSLSRAACTAAASSTPFGSASDRVPSAAAAPTAAAAAAESATPAAVSTTPAATSAAGEARRGKKRLSPPSPRRGEQQSPTLQDEQPKSKLQQRMWLYSNNDALTGSSSTASGAPLPRHFSPCHSEQDFEQQQHPSGPSSSNAQPTAAEGLEQLPQQQQQHP